MSAEIRAESQVEPDPAATSIGNDQTAAGASKPEETIDVSAAPTVSEDAIMAEEKTAEGVLSRELSSIKRRKLTSPDKKSAEDGDEISKMAVGDAKEVEPVKETKNTERNDDRRSNGYPNKRQRGENIKTDYSVLPESSDADEIRRQVEFYFSDSNLPTDKYLLDQSGGHKNLPVDLKVIHNFKRMRHFQPYSAVLEAVKQSQVLIVNDKDEITRKEPLSDKFTADIEQNRKIHQDRTMARSVYAKGFGDETKRTQTDVEEFFGLYGTVNAVRLRRKADGLFKGSVFVEFATEQEAEDFLKLDPKPKFKAADGEEKELAVKSKKAYVDEKVDDIKEGRLAPNSPRKNNGGGQRRDGGNWNDRRDRDQGGRGRGGRGGGRGRGNNRGGSRGRGGRDGRDRDDRRGGRDRNAENDRKRSAPDSGEQGDSKKTKTDE